MKERPILFSTPMVRALLAGTKTQTRRVIKKYTPLAACPYGKKGDKLWVRETWSHDAPTLEECRSRHEDIMTGGSCVSYGPYYKASEENPETLKWKPSIFMPRWASRITLRLTDVRIERVQDITNSEALAEGTPDLRTMENGWDMRDCFRELWDSISKKRGYGWDKNPLVWVLQFEKEE